VLLDRDGHVLDISLQSRRDVEAAKRFFRKLKGFAVCASGDGYRQAQELCSGKARDPAPHRTPP